MTLSVIVTCLVQTLVLSGVLSMSQGQETAKIYGRITDLFGYPIQGARLQVFSYETQPNRGTKSPAETKAIQTTLSDKEGNYEVSGLSWGEYRITVSYRGFAQAEVGSVYLGKGADRLLDLGLKVGQIVDLPTMEISGTVSQTGAALPDATVTAVSAFNPQVIQQTRTNKKGYYRIDLNTPGQYLVYASKPGFAVVVQSMVSGAQKKTDFILTPLRVHQSPSRLNGY